MRTNVGWTLAGLLVLLTANCGFGRDGHETIGSAVAAGNGGQKLVVSIGPVVPKELNPSGGGAPEASPDQAAAFAWQEFIALNWPAGMQLGKPGQREAPSTTFKFADSSYQGPLVWETFRGKVEIFPASGTPPGYQGSTAGTSWGYDALPQYQYVIPIPACDPQQAQDDTPWINLDETDQITLDNMYAGIVQPSSSPGNSAPQLIRFLAKADRNEYAYVAGNSDPNDPMSQWWSAIPQSVVKATKDYLIQNMKSPPAGSSKLVSLPDNTIELKAAWRPLNPSELSSGRFHAQAVRFYERNGSGATCYRDAMWGLVALHIIQKTPSAPYFIYATFEQADNILTSSAQHVEDADGNMLLKPATATTPQTCLADPKPSSGSGGPESSTSGMVILTDDPSTCKASQTAQYCGAPGSQLYYRNAKFEPPNNQPSDGDICVNRRLQAIPDYVIAANKNAHAAIAAYLAQEKIQAPGPWLSYKLVNVQYYPYDKIPNPAIPNGSPYQPNPPYTAANPAPSSYYQANIVVETNRSLQLFSGGLSPNIATDWNQDGTFHKNSYYGGKHYNSGGCLGCHGSQGQSPPGRAGDFSVILARGAVLLPEPPALETSQGLATVKRNRSLTR